ncbi:hypothetical protein TWF281_001353 [Arthrobotrys megalospora]
MPYLLYPEPGAFPNFWIKWLEYEFCHVTDPFYWTRWFCKWLLILSVLSAMAFVAVYICAVIMDMVMWCLCKLGLVAFKEQEFEELDPDWFKKPSSWDYRSGLDIMEHVRDTTSDDDDDDDDDSGDDDDDDKSFKRGKKDFRLR